MSEPLFNFHDTILFATVFQSLLFVVLILWAKHHHHISDYFLIGFFLCQIAIPTHILINYGEAFRFVALANYPSLFRLFDIAYWLEGPLLLWYTRALLYKDFKLKSFDLAFIAPTLIYSIYVIFSFHIVDTSTKVELIVAAENVRVSALPVTSEIVRELVRVFFAVLCLIDIRNAQKQLRDRYSSIEKVDFSWLSFLVIGFVVLRVWILIVALIKLVSPGLGYDVFNVLGIAGNYGSLALISTLIFFSLTRSKIFGDDHADDIDDNPKEFEIDPALTLKIKTHMEENRPYLHHFLNLEQLSDQLDMHPRALSQVIKQHFNTNFYEFVNSYRIEEAKKYLQDPSQKDKTMIDILGECGFNSKATYNTFFKKLVGVTPTQYRASQLGKG